VFICVHLWRYFLLFSVRYASAEQTNESPVNPLTTLQEDPSHPEPSPHASLDDVAREKVAAWVREHWDAVFAMLYRICPNRHEAEDLTQETFLRAGRRHATFAPGSNTRAWLMRIAVNAHLDLRRRQQVAGTRPLNDTPSPARPPESRIAHNELAAAIDTALTGLSEPARVVFLLRTREGMSFADIARVIETSEATARWHMLQARRHLLDQLKDFAD